MWRKVREFVQESGMLVEGDRVVVAVSGGADSVCLLKVLAESGMGLRLRVLHVHHGLRGGEADRDAEFVRGLCGRVGVPFEVVYRNVREYAGERGLSEEEAGRILRYEALEEGAARWERESDEGKRPVWIAVAHHQDDNAETILHHLLRGSGLRGLTGMRPVQGRRIRPLLRVRRSEILAYLQEEGWEWCEDSSNESGAYTRNRIRRELIPYMTEHVNARAVENLLHAAEIIGQADEYLSRQAACLWERLGRVEPEDAGSQGGQRGISSAESGRECGQAEEKAAGHLMAERRESGHVERVGIALAGFREQEEIIRVYLIRHMLMLAAPGQRDVTARHIRQILRLAEGSVGGRCDLPGGIVAVRTYQELSVECCRGRHLAGATGVLPSEAGDPAAIAEVVLPAPGEGAMRLGDWEFRVFFQEKGTEIPKKEYTKWFDYDKIKATLSVRCREEGDYFTLAGGGRKQLNRFLIDEKIPRGLRDGIPVLAEGNHILWVVGYRISEYYKIMEATHTILQVDFYGGKAYGR